MFCPSNKCQVKYFSHKKYKILFISKSITWILNWVVHNAELKYKFYQIKQNSNTNSIKLSRNEIPYLKEKTRSDGIFTNLIKIKNISNEVGSNMMIMNTNCEGSGLSWPWADSEKSCSSWRVPPHTTLRWRITRRRSPQSGDWIPRRTDGPARLPVSPPW